MEGATIWQHNRNNNKYIEVIQYACGHYAIQEYMKWGEVKNKIGRDKKTRISKTDLLELLKDYRKVS